jgi:signal transduction histidine kinase
MPLDILMDTEYSALSARNDPASVFQDIILATGTTLTLPTVLQQITEQVVEITPCQRALVLVVDDDNINLEFGAASRLPDAPEMRHKLERLSFNLYNADSSPIIAGWLQGNAYKLTLDNAVDHAALQWLAASLPAPHRYSLPLLHQEKLIGLLIVDSDAGLDSEQHTRLKVIAAAATVVIQNGRIYNRTVHQAETHMRELTILRQIDRELNDTIEPHHVFQMTLDWALRFTNAHAASIGLYEQETDVFRIIANYGYDLPPDQLELVRSQRASIAHRVARSGHAEVVPDVSLDKDFIRGASLTQSQLSVPVMREDRVIAVISVESKKINGFTDDHQNFVEKLAARAGVAIDNARLFDETEREREKLSHIINNTADIVIVIGHDERLVLINAAAFSALNLYPTQNYTGRKFQDVFADTNVYKAYRQAKAAADQVVEEVVLPNDRVFHMNMTRHENVGWIIVMHDITPFKEMDQLKSELIATVSHDLKQPLAVMNGYIELLLMHKQLDDTGISFIEMVRKSVHNMRQLIDDLLDLAKIETGIQLELEPVDVCELITECVDALRPTIMTKSMTVHTDFAPDLLPLLADRSRMEQILMNLISNAVKYTQPEGQVRVVTQKREGHVRILIQDNGMGISPEDQKHIFERFYRVRRPETDSIDGTGLGLAIVKSLIEAHNGQIGLESRLGEGTTFFVTLPTVPNDSLAATS